MKKQNVEKGIVPLRQILIGIAVAVIAGLMGAALIAYLVGQGSLEEEMLKTVMVLMNLLASAVGCLVAVLTSRRSILITSGAVGAGYFLLLFCGNLLLMDGKMEGALWTALMVLTGAATAVLVGLRSV